MELSGKISKILPLQSGQGKNGIWKKQDYVLEYGDQYPKLLCFNLWGDKIDQFAVSEGENVTVHFDVESREFNGKYYTDVKAWKIDRGNNNSVASSNTSDKKSEFGVPAPDFLVADEKDDLPF
jgi:hypothetical protein